MKKSTISFKNSRKIAPTKQLKIIIVDSAQDKENGDGVPTKKYKIDTGMEKDEKKEVHVKAALESQANLKSGGNQASESIPIPVFEILNASDPLLMEIRKNQTHLLNSMKGINESVDHSESSEQDRPVSAYTLQEEDADWLKKICNNKQQDISYDDFEAAIEILEVSSKHAVTSFAAFSAEFPQWNRRRLELIYDYWLDKKMELCMLFPKGSLIPTVPMIDEYYIDGNEDPYVAFREREREGRRRSSRIAQNTLQSQTSDTHSGTTQTEEQTAAERAEKLERMTYQINLNSEIDGRYSFQRNKFCIYKKPGIEYFTFEE